MSDLLNQASLVYIPSGYKEDKAYSVIPTDGSGDLTFTRASDGTRVNSQGLVERVPWNLLQQSNTFNTTWTLSNATVTSGQSGYDGSSNAWLQQSTSTFCRVEQSTTITGVVNFSVYSKAGTSNFLLLEVTGNLFYAWFNLSTGQVGSKGGAYISATMTSVGNGWYKCELVGTQTTSGQARIRATDANNSTVTTTSSNIYIQDAQLVEGSTAKPYFPTTNRQDVPRLDYSGGCPSLLLEPQRTNLQQYSEQFDNAVWSDSGTIVPNQATSPDGTQNADLFYAATGTGKRIIDSQTISSGTAYTSSVFAKASGCNFVFFPDIDNQVNSVWFDLSNGTFSTPIEGTAKIENYGNGWYRCSLTTTSNTTTGYSYFGISSTSGSTSFTANGTDGVLFWGAQLEAGSYPTSYIPTTSASVTRVADAAYKTGISSLIGQTEGTIYWNGTIDNFSNFATLLSLEGVSNSWIYFLSYSGGLTFEVRSNNIVSASYVSASTTGAHKIALAYNASQVDIYIDGVSVYTDYSVTIPATSNLYLAGWSGYNQSIKTSQALLFKTRLTNAELAALTTL